MNTKHLLLYATTLICSTNAYSMERLATIHDNNTVDFLLIPEDIWLHIIAQYQFKDTLRKTCKYFRNLASSSNEKILLHPSLTLSQKALERFALYHGALGDSAIVRNLLAIGADPNACGDNKMTLMHYAAQYDYVDIVDMLLKHPALITTDIAKNEQSPWMLAIKHDQSIVAKHIFLTCKLHGVDALCDASKCGALNSLRTLLACNVDINSPSSIGSYPLIEAAIKGHSHIIRFLITNGAVVECRCKYENNIDATPLHFAAYFGHTSATQLLIEYGANVNIKGGDGNYTPLHCASSKGHVQIIKILLDNGAHVNEITNNCTPLDLAKDDAIKQLLIAHGGKTGAQLKQAELKQNEPEKDNCVMQ